MKNIMIYTKKRRIAMKSILSEVKINANIIMLTNFMICGIIIGSGLFFLSDYKFGLVLDSFVSDFIFDYNNVLILFIREILLSIVFIFSSFFFGLSCVGTPVICILPVIEGILFGLCFSSFLFRNEIQGLLSAILCLLPGFSILATVSLISFSISFDMSSRLSSEIFSNNKVSKNLRTYSFEYIILLGLSLISAIISSVTKLLFF